MKFKSYITSVFSVLSFLTIQAQNAVSLTEIKVESTFHHISIHCNITGDINLDSEMGIEFRPKNSGSYMPGAMSMRAHPGLIIDGSSFSMNFHAASAMFLTPDTEYDVKVTLTDPDGGDIVSDIVVSTKAIPATGSNVKYVSPGSGGGSGTIANPYLGLQSAADAAMPGDHFIVAPGNYDSFSFNTSGTAVDPISFESEILHGAIIDGAGTSTGVVTLGVFDDSLSYVHIDGFKIMNGARGIDAQNTIYLTVQNCYIEQVDNGILNRRANGWEHDQYFYNNTLIGNTAWPQSGIPGERGIDIRGNNNVIANNTISYFGDGISTDGPPYLTSYSLDIYNNDIHHIVDDLIEVDGSISNTRVYSNRGFNGRMGVSLAPIFGGPCYVFRNQFFNLETSAFKMNRGPSGLVIVHNTSVKIENGMSSPSGWQNTYFRNNVVVGSRYCFEEYGLVSGSVDDWDYDAYFSTRSGTNSEPWFKWDNIKYPDVPTLQSNTTIENNSIAVDYSDFNDITIPTAYTTSYDPSQRDLSPVSGSAVIDAGATLDNLNVGFVTDGLSDIGCIEDGQPIPTYGAEYIFSTCDDGIKNGDETYVDCGGSCTACDDCPYATITISDMPLDQDLDLKTSDWIMSNAIIPHDRTVVLKAANFIELLSGFETVLGADLLVEPEGCN